MPARTVLPRRVPGRAVAACAALVVLCGCGWGGSDDDGGPLPGAPTGVTAVAGSATSVHVMWNAVSAPSGIAGYEVYRGTAEVRDVPASAHMVDVPRLSPATTYVFTVRARDADGRLGPRSRAVRATTPAAVPADGSAPTTPRAVRGRAAGSHAVRLSWSRSADDRGVVSYDVLQGATKIHSVPGDRTEAVVTGLRAGTRYSFTVRARDAAGNLSPAGAPVRVTTAPGSDDGRDLAPSAFRAGTHRAGGAYCLDLSWIPPRTDGVVTEYQIQLDQAPGRNLGRLLGRAHGDHRPSGERTATTGPGGTAIDGP